MCPIVKETVIRNFEKISTSNTLLELPIDLLVSILDSTELSIQHENSVYKIVSDYVKSNESILDDEDQQLFENLWNCVRFHLLNFENIENVIHNESIPRSIAMNSLMSWTIHNFKDSPLIVSRNALNQFKRLT